ncbi:piccolo Zn-finger [Trichinella nativa]|uniref:Piccolo Zn-finger n=1 Tax=Trichinella nativa TaxID=6335 RepID=A0A1Y3EH09_9BILA|nr:piccolo Zn-finger [Trichinella nativa]
MFGKVFGGITHAVSHTASQLRTQVLAPQFNATVDPLAGLSEVERAHILAVQRRAADEDSKLSQQPMVLPRSTASTVDATASLPLPSLAPSTLPSRPSSASSTETEGADDTSDDDDDDSGPIPDLDQIGLSEVTPADMRLDGLAEIGQERLLTSQESIEEQPTIVVHSPSTNSNGAHYSSPESDTQDVVEPVVQIPGDQENLQLAATDAGDESPSSSGDEWNCEYAGESFTAPIRKSIEIDEPTTTPQSNERPIYQTEPAASSPPPAADTTASSLFNYDQTDPTEWTNVEPLLLTQEIELSSNETDQSVMNKAPGVEMDEEASSQTFYGDESSNPFLDGASFADDQAISELVPVEEPDEEVDEEKLNNDNEQQLVIDASADEQLSTALAEPIPSSDDDRFGVDEKIISQAEKTFATVADHADSFGISNIAAAASSVVIERQTSRSLTETTSRSIKQPFGMPAASQAKLQSANKIASAALDGFGGKSLKNFGGLFSRPKVDFSSFATSVKKSTEAALKKATDSVASSFSSSSVVSMSQDSFNSNNQPCTVPPKSPSSSAINTDNASVNSNKSSDQWSALEVDKADNNNNSSAVMKSTAAAVVGKKGIQPSPVVSNTFRVSCNSDSTEDTGYSSRCSPEDEFYRVGSDGAQFLITYDSSRKLGVDTVKAPLSPRRRINPFIEDGIFSQRLITSVIVEQADDQLTKSFHVSGQKRQLDIVEKVEPGEQEKFHLIAEQSFWSSEPLQSQQLFGEIDGPQEISQAGKDSTPKIEEVETLPLPDESTPLKYPPQQSIANSGADEIAKLFAVEDSAPDSSACTQMYDSSEVSSEQFDEDAQKRITEIESEFLLQNNQSADSVEDWQMCPLCQMAEVHVRPDGVSINGQPCGNCGLTVCSKCGHVVEQNGRKVWLCGICDSNIAETNGRWYCDATKSQAISEDDNSKLTFEKSQEVDSDISDQASDSSDSYPDVVIEVPSSPVKQLDFDQEFSTSNSKQCYKVFRDIEKHFMNNFDQCDDTKHEGKVDHHDQQTGHSDKGNFETDPFKTVPISVGQSPTFEKLTEQASPSDAQLSIGEEIFGKIVPPEQSCPSTNSNNAQEDSIDYAQAMRYYNTQPFYIHRPGPVYTILEDDEEVMELNQDGKNKTAYMAAISASRPSTLSSSSSKSQLTSFSSPLANSYVGLDRPAQQMQTSSNASTEQLTSTVSSDVLVQHFFATSTTSTTTTSITASKSHALTAVQQSNSTFTPKPVRIAPPPPPPSQYSISR